MNESCIFILYHYAFISNVVRKRQVLQAIYCFIKQLGLQSDALKVTCHFLFCEQAVAIDGLVLDDLWENESGCGVRSLDFNCLNYIYRCRACNFFCVDNWRFYITSGRFNIESGRFGIIGRHFGLSNECFGLSPWTTKVFSTMSPTIGLRVLSEKLDESECVASELLSLVTALVLWAHYPLLTAMPLAGAFLFLDGFLFAESTNFYFAAV